MLLGVIAVWIAANILFDVQPERPDAQDAKEQLGPYHDDMSLRETFESFPESGPGAAELRLLRDNELAWAARWDLLDKAQRSIDVSYFILRQDIFGVAFLAHLLKKAQDGVQVRVLLDAFGSRLSWHPKGNDYLDTLVNTGNVEVRMYRPLRQRIAEGLLHLNPVVALASEHDKILVVDGERAITGGRNIGVEYFSHPADAEFVFQDVEVEIKHRPTAAALIAAFEAQYGAEDADRIMRERLDIQSQADDLEWAYGAMTAWLRGEPLPDHAQGTPPGPRAGWADELREMQRLKGSLAKALPDYLGAETRVLDSVTRFNDTEDGISRGATRLVESARREIFIQSPYLVLTEPAVKVFARASQRGVPITILTNSPASSDSDVSQAFFLEQWPHLVARIPSLRLYGNGADQKIHAKVASFDKVLSLVGTYNLSPESMALNSEVMVAVWSRDFADKLTKNPRARLAAGEPKTYRYRIARDRDGTPQRDEDGELIVEFGPEDHTDVENMTKLQAYRKSLEAADKLPGVSPYFIDDYRPE